jgi:hypothetical protein
MGPWADVGKGEKGYNNGVMGGYNDDRIRQ